MKQFLQISVAVALATAAASSLASPANPLMRPASPAQAAVSMPPLPTDSSFSTANGADKVDERVKAAQNTMVVYNVVAISGDTAVLRVTAQPSTQAQAATTGSATPTAGQVQSAGYADFYGVAPSLVVTDKQHLVIQDVPAVAAVRQGSVTLLTADGQRALYRGRLSGNASRGYQGFVWSNSDAAYTARQSPPLNKALEQPSAISNGSTTSTSAN